MNDLAYFEMRLRKEKEKAWSSTSHRARQCHEDLAAAYELRIWSLMDQLRSDEERRVQEALESQGF